MKIGIVGAGNVGQALGRNWSKREHHVRYGVRDPASARYASLPPGAVVTAAEAAEHGDVVVLATPWPATEAACRGFGDLGGKVILDCTNPLRMGAGGLELALGYTQSGGELVQSWCAGARVVKTLNQVGAEIMADPSGLAHRPVMFMAGNDEQAKRTTARLLDDLGFDPLDAGDITRARLLEPFGMVWINQALLRGKGRNWAFAAVTSS